jgi:sugar-specific transcriptional regulator TrmB
MDQPTLTNEYYMTREFLERQIAALQEAIEKKDAYIIRLQDEVSEKSRYAHTVKSEKQNLINTIKEYVIEALRDREMMHGNAEALAEICDFELTKTVTVTATVDFEVEVEVPFDADVDEVANTLEFSVDSFDYSIDDFTVDTQSLQASDNIS